MIFAILIAFFVVGVVLFLSFFLPNQLAEVDENTHNLDLRGTWKAYLAVFIGTTVVIANVRLLSEGRAYFRYSDIYSCIIPLLAVSPGARRLYWTMRDFILCYKATKGLRA